MTIKAIMYRLSFLTQKAESSLLTSFYSSRIVNLSNKRLIVILTAFLANLVFSLIATNQAFSEPSFAKYVGVGSCSSSNCHGGVSPKAGSTILQNEYITWQKQDLHSRAYNSLLSPEGRRIGKLLGLEHPEKEALCLDCHATNPKPELRAATFQIEDGVSCESCHGAAEHYLESHAANDATRERSISHGLKDIVAPKPRADLCTSCHLGDNTKRVTHRLIGAGHPRLTFELDTFSMIQPRHWVMDVDYRKKKGAFGSATVWLVGQIANSRRMLELLSRTPNAAEGEWPEFSLMYCFTCHHSLSEKQWTKREYNGNPGEPRLNTASLKIVAAATAARDKGLSEKIKAGLDKIHASYGTNEINQNITYITDLLNQADTSAMISTGVEDWLKKMFIILADLGANSLYPQYELAEQIAMGLQSVATTIDPSGSYFKGDIERIYQSLNSSDGFNPETFVTACKALSDRLR